MGLSIDKENVISSLDNALVQMHGCGRYTPEDVDELETAAWKALELLKEQEPKQIICKQEKCENSDGSINHFAEWYCPHCNMLILRGFNDPSIKFCYRCGKPILWEKPVKWNG